MDSEYEALSRRATKGDKQALADLFALAESYQAQDRVKEAMTTYRDAAISYRIAAFRNLSLAESAGERLNWEARIQDIYRQWIDDNPSGIRSFPYDRLGIDRDRMNAIVLRQISQDPRFMFLMSYLEDVLSRLGMEFSAPGGTIERRICTLLEELYGFERSGLESYLNNTSVRIALDQIAAEIERRSKSTSE